MSVHNYLQVQCGCNDGQSYAAYADPEYYADGCIDCGQTPIIKTYDEADDPEYFIAVAEGELEMYNHHSRVDDPRREYRLKTQHITDPNEKLCIAKEICEHYTRNL